MATAASLASVPSKLRERMAVIELSGYTEVEKRVIATGHLLPLQLAFHGLTAGQVRITDEAVEAVIRGYTREAGVWDLAGILGALCAKVVRRRADGHGRDEHQEEEKHAESEEEHGEEHGEHGEHDEHQGNEAPVEVTSETVVEMLGAPAHPDEEVAGRTARPGVAVGLCRNAAGGELSFVEASRMPGSGALTLTGRQGEVMRESAQAALSWLRANAGRYGLDPAFHRSTTCICTCSRARWRRRAPRPGSRWRPRWCPHSPGGWFAATWP